MIPVEIFFNPLRINIHFISAAGFSASTLTSPLPGRRRLLCVLVPSAGFRGEFTEKLKLFQS